MELLLIKFLLQKIRSLRWFIFLAVFFSTLIVFIGVTSISSLLYERLMDEQASYITEQLSTQTDQLKIDLPSISTQVRLTYIGSFLLYSLIFLIIAFVFSHFAVRRINQSIEEFSQQINQIKTSKDLKNFKPEKLNFIFNELNQAFSNISELARQLGRVLNDKNLLEIKANLLSKLVIKNTRLDNWNEYIKNTFIDISNTLPFDFICVLLTEKNQQQVKFFWSGGTNAAAKQQAEQLISQQLNLTINPSDLTKSFMFTHYQLAGHLAKNFYAQPKLLVQHIEKQPQVGSVQGVFIHSKAMQDVALRLSVNSLLVVLVNLLGASKAISGYTQQLETVINLSEHENAMAAEVLYGHLLVKNTDQLPGINYQVLSSSRFSGDIIQVKRSPTGSTFVLVADATGHGLSATITVMPVITVFNAMVQKGYQLPFILSEMNKHLVRDLPDDRFVAALLVEINPHQQEVSIWNGAMPAALQINQQGEIIEKYQSKHMALGILDADIFDGTPERLLLPLDGQLLLYSDGLIEQEDPSQQAFGYQGLVSTLEATKTEEKLIDTIIKNALKHAQLEQPDDDISVCQINFNYLEEQTTPSNVSNLLCTSLLTPFEWQMKVYGSQLAQQSLPALCNEFMQAQGLSLAVKSWAFNIINQLIQKVVETNLLQLDLTQQHLKHQVLENLTDDYYLLLKFQGNPQSSSPEDKRTNACLIIEISDNGQGESNLIDQANLADIRSLADQVTVSQQGHHIQVRLG